MIVLLVLAVLVAVRTILRGQWLWCVASTSILPSTSSGRGTS